jgi:hypothetical protein
MKEVTFDNEVIRINVEFTEHSNQRMQEREIDKKDIENLIDEKIDLILTKIYNNNDLSIKQRVFNESFSIILETERRLDIITGEPYYNFIVITCFKTSLNKELFKSTDITYEEYVDFKNNIEGSYNKIRISLTNFAKKTMKINHIKPESIVNLILKGKDYILNNKGGTKEGVDYKFIHSTKNFSVILNSKVRENKTIGKYIDLIVIKVDLFLYEYEKIKKRCKHQYYI